VVLVVVAVLKQAAVVQVVSVPGLL